MRQEQTVGLRSLRDVAHDLGVREPATVRIACRRHGVAFTDDGLEPEDAERLRQIIRGERVGPLDDDFVLGSLRLGHAEAAMIVGERHGFEPWQATAIAAAINTRRVNVDELQEAGIPRFWAGTLKLAIEGFTDE